MKLTYTVVVETGLKHFTVPWGTSKMEQIWMTKQLTRPILDAVSAYWQHPLRGATVTISESETERERGEK
jgi:hypothetical protein